MELGLVALSDALRSKNEIAAMSWDPSGWLEIPPHGGVEEANGATRDEARSHSHGLAPGRGNPRKRGNSATSVDARSRSQLMDFTCTPGSLAAQALSSRQEPVPFSANSPRLDVKGRCLATPICPDAWERERAPGRGIRVERSEFGRSSAARARARIEDAIFNPQDR